MRKIVELLILFVFIMTNAYSRPLCGGATKKRRSVFGSRKRGKRQTQVHELSGEHTKKAKIDRNLRKKKPVGDDPNRYVIMIVLIRL